MREGTLEWEGTEVQNGGAEDGTEKRGPFLVIFPVKDRLAKYRERRGGKVSCRAGKKHT